MLEQTAKVVLEGIHVYKQAPKDVILSSIILNKVPQWPKKTPNPTELDLANKVKVLQTECYGLASARVKTKIPPVLFSTEYEVTKNTSSDRGKVIKTEYSFRLKCWYQ